MRLYRRFWRHGSPDRALFYRFKIRKRQFGIYRVDVRNRVNCIGHVSDIFIFETAHHMGDGIAFPDVGEVVASPSPLEAPPPDLQCPKFDRGGDKLFWFDQFSKFVQSCVGNRRFLGSIVQKGKLAAMPASVRALNRVDFPTLGNPHSTFYRHIAMILCSLSLCAATSWRLPIRRRRPWASPRYRYLT